ncbi:MAG: benzoate transporter [Rhodospirillaceae bacterium]|nr:benzoate transporter [Rhodospirillaceae bacterium]
MDRHAIVGGAVATLFACTGPLALILAVAQARGIETAFTTGWIFAGYAVGGVLSIAFSYIYRTPIGLAWTIPGTAMLFAALENLTLGEALGAYLVTGLVLTFLGTTGWIGWIMNRIPVPIVMGMVAGVFLPIGLEVVLGFANDAILAGATVAGFLIASAVPGLGRIVPPVLAGLVTGALAVVFSGQMPEVAIGEHWVIRPIVFQPVFTWRAMAELVLPLTIAVVAIQNLQGVTVLRQAGHEPPVNALTIACGYGSLIMGAFGSVPTCVTGPVNGILVTSGAVKEKQWAGGVVFGVMILLFGLFSPVMTSLATSLPTTFIAVLGGLAMLPVLTGAFRNAFSVGPQLGTLIAFMVTVSEIKFLNIGAPFWGLVFGYAVAWLLEREHLSAKT